MPYVAVIGGFYELDPITLQKATNRAKEFGAALASAGFGLVVYFSDAGSLETHVVSGYIAAQGTRAAGSIRVRYPESQRGQVRFPEQATHSDVFDPVIFPGQDWEEPFYRSVAEAEGVDAVLLMAGGKSTLIAGHIAVARQLPVLAADEFDGAARVIWAKLSSLSNGYPSSTNQPPDKQVAWLRTQCAAYNARLTEARRRENFYRRVTSETNRATWAGATFLLLLGMLYFGVAQPPSPTTYSYLMFATLVVSGATGALIRAVRWTSKETAVTTSLLLGAVAGLVVGLAYLLPQFVGAPGVLEVTSTAVRATDKVQFISAMLVAFTAGIGFDTVFDRLRKEAHQVPVTI
jgi:hypothetical protein